MARIQKSSAYAPPTNYGINGVDNVPVSDGSNFILPDGYELTAPAPGLEDMIKPDDNEFVQRVKNSKPYRDAYALFYPLSNKRWLQLLESIPYSVDMPNDHWTDFFTNDYANQLDINYNYCIDQIQQLVKDYDTYVSKLPTTQANELAQVGYNSAITGDGLEVGSADHGENPSYTPQRSAPGLEALSALSNVILTGIPSVISTAVNIGNSFKQLGLQKDTLALSRESLGATLKGLDISEKTYLADMQKYLIDKGVDISNLGSDVFDSLDNYLKYSSQISNDPSIAKRINDAQVEYLKSRIRNQAIVPHLESLADWDSEFEWNGRKAYQFYNEFMNLELEQFLSTKQYEAKQSKYNADFYTHLNGKSSAEAQNAMNKMNMRKSEFDAKFYQQRLSFYEDWIARSKNDPVSKLCLIQALFSDEVITTSATTQGVARIVADATIEQNAPSNPWKPSNILPMD